MPLLPLPNPRLQPLIRTHLSRKEDSETQKLIEELAVVRKRGFLTKPELEKICRWKSARVIKLICSNNEEKIKNITKSTFAARSEQKKLELLRKLRGVSVPMASAILTLTNPKRYGVVDIRVWQLLYKLRVVESKPGGIGFDFNHWHQFLMILRYYAKKYYVKARDVERTLFNLHKKYQRGRLYKK
jgi:hypothetical protein